MGKRGRGAQPKMKPASPNPVKLSVGWQNKRRGRAKGVIRFFKVLPITKGPLAGTKMKLLPSQRVFISRGLSCGPDRVGAG